MLGEGPSESRILALKERKFLNPKATLLSVLIALLQPSVSSFRNAPPPLCGGRVLCHQREGIRRDGVFGIALYAFPIARHQFGVILRAFGGFLRGLLRRLALRSLVRRPNGEQNGVAAFALGVSYLKIL